MEVRRVDEIRDARREIGQPRDSIHIHVHVHMSALGLGDGHGDGTLVGTGLRGQVRMSRSA